MPGQIKLDDTPLVSAFADDDDAGTSLVVTYCGEGQSVWVMCPNDNGQLQVMFDSNYRWSTLSGTLLRLA